MDDLVELKQWLRKRIDECAQEANRADSAEHRKHHLSMQVAYYEVIATLDPDLHQTKRSGNG